MSYDVIVAGASFGGLAVASRLRGKRVLVLDRKPIGTGQTSACGTLLSTLQALGLEESVLQVHPRLVLHVGGRTFEYPLEEPFCTFDYGLLCRRLWAQADAEFVQAAVLGREGGRVRTTKGTFEGRFLVDATGWRAALTRAHRPEREARSGVNFGIETEVYYKEEEGLHFWFGIPGGDPRTIGWVFPVGSRSRIGVGSYGGKTALGPDLDALLAYLGVSRGEVHGGFFSYQLREPVIEDLFLVGDAAGHCLGLTGEGIRPALFFGVRLGTLLREVLDGVRSLESARQQYRREVERRRRGYRILAWAQTWLPRLPLPFLQALGLAGTVPAVGQSLLARYFRAFPFDGPEGGRGWVPSKI